MAEHTISSSGPEVTLGAQKAVVAAIAGGIVAAATSLVTALSDNVVTGGEWLTALIALIVGAGLTGGTTYAKSTKVTLN